MEPLLFSFPAGREVEYLRDEQGKAAGAIIREWKALNGSVEIRSLNCHDEVVRVTVQVDNLTESAPATSPNSATREDTLLHSLVSAHTILGAENGEFLSLLEPPTGFEDSVAQCHNLGTWPVLATDTADAMLSSPIILYDHPQIAPESAGNLFDSTEIDEILSLRILTLTEDEKREMRQSDDRTRGILERTENMPEEQFMKLHGILRGLRPTKEEIQ
jgi:hydrogenase maturation protease